MDDEREPSMQTMTAKELNAMVGGTLVGPGGEKIGKIRDVYVDQRSREPEWLAVATGMFGTKVSFVPLSGVRQNNGDEYTASFDKEQVKGAPTAEADGTLSEAEEDRLYRHYAMTTPSATTPSATTPSATTPSTGTRDRRAPTDDAMTRSEEELRVGTATEERGRARLRKWVETEHVSTTVPVSHEEVRVVREPITEENRDRAMSGADITEDTHDVTLREERAVVGKETVPRERVRLEKETVTEEQPVEADLRKEHIGIEGDGNQRGRRGS
jgi:uncharacterized protein (TIGR02271 family)